MKGQKRSLVVVFLVLQIALLASSVSIAVATPVYLRTTAFTVVGRPTTLWSCPVCVQITYQNNLNSTMRGVVFAVYHNSMGQTVYLSTATIAPSGGQHGTALLGATALPHGQYSVSVFVITSNEISISEVSILNITFD